MDWANERYVRIYTRDTAFLIAIGHTARGLLWDIMRKADRAGVIQLDGMTPERVVAAVTGYPLDVVEECLPMLSSGAGAPVSITTNAVVVRNYIEANETPSTNAQRCRAKRERARAFSQLGDAAQDLRATQNVSPATRDDGPTTQNVSRATQNVSKVTRSDPPTTRNEGPTTRNDRVATTRTVPCRAVPCRAVPSADADRVHGHASTHTPDSGALVPNGANSTSTPSVETNQSREGVQRLPWGVFWSDLRGHSPPNSRPLTMPLEPPRHVVDLVLENGGDETALQSIRETAIAFADLIRENPTARFLPDDPSSSFACSIWQLSMFKPKAWSQVCRLVTARAASKLECEKPKPVRYDGRGNPIEVAT